MLSHAKKWMAAVVLSAASAVAFAADFEAGKHYKVLEEPVAVMQDGKIHVEEAFWYGCPHCYDLESKISPWKKELADDVVFEGVPAMFGRAWIVHAQLYYTADSLGVLDKVHSQIFDAIHLQKLRLLTREEQRDFLVAKAGVTAEDFDKAYDSFSVRSRMTRGDKRVRSFKISGVPALVVNGKYVIDATSAGSQEAMLEVADYLIEQERGN
ncbi:MAG: thiol:disulfide interchange protein DsbA/DsbL [Thalassolituus sp.]